jgi:uncharacterized protein (TIGR02452 family)
MEVDVESSQRRPHRQSGRQTLLNFSNGQLSTRLPLSNPIPRSDAARMSLADIAKQTVQLLPGLLATRPDVGTKGFLFKSSGFTSILPNLHPNLPPTAIRVIDSDTIDAALSLSPPANPSSNTTSQTQTPSSVCILNMANATHAGGGFKHGALAQEESICYRSSLIFTLKLRFYPLPDQSAIFSPRVLIIRENLVSGHDLLDLRVPADLPVLSVISCAAVCQPALKKDFTIPATASGTARLTYAHQKDKQLMLSKMRIILRTCMINDCRKVVLGAFGCGAFANPPGEVAEMWKTVLSEPEFGGWWEEIVFAVLDGRNDDNFTVFKMVLDGLRV